MRPGLYRHHLISFVGVVAGHFTSSPSAPSLPHVSCRAKIKFLSERKKKGRSSDSALVATSISGSGIFIGLTFQTRPSHRLAIVTAAQNHFLAANDNHDIANRSIWITPDRDFRRRVFAGHRNIFFAGKHFVQSIPKTRAELLTSQAARGCVLTSKAVRRRQLALVLCRAQSLGAAIKLTDMREIADYVWVHPGEERYAATGSTGGALIVARRCSNTAMVSLRLSRRAAGVMASKGYVTSERSNNRRAFRLSGPVLRELHLCMYFTSSFASR